MPMEVGDGQKEEVDTNRLWPVDVHLECGDHRTLLFLHHTSEVREGLHGRMHINVMVQVLQTQDGSLPQGLTVQNTYTKLRKGQ